MDLIDLASEERGYGKITEEPLQSGEEGIFFYFHSKLAEIVFFQTAKWFVNGEPASRATTTRILLSFVSFCLAFLHRRYYFTKLFLRHARSKEEGKTSF